MKKIFKRIFIGIMATVTALSTVVFSGCKENKSGSVSSAPTFNIVPDTDYGISLTSAVISEADYETYGVTAEAESAYTLTASYKEPYVTYPEMDWSVEFVNPTSDFATDKVVTDYITVEPTEDGALTAVVTALQAFGEPIKVVATNRFTPTVSASVVCDYVAYVEYFSVTLSPVSSSDIYTELGGNIDVYKNLGLSSMVGSIELYDSSEINDSFVGLRTLQMSPLTYTTGTVNSSISDSFVSFKVGCYGYSGIYDLLISAGFTMRESVINYDNSSTFSIVTCLQLSLDESFCIGLPYIDFFVEEQRNLVLQTWEYLRGYRLEKPDNYDDGALYYAYMEIMTNYFYEYTASYGSLPIDGRMIYEICLKDEGLGQRYYKFGIEYPDDWFDVEATAINTDVTNIVFGG